MTTMSRMAAAAAVVVVLGLLTGCGGDESSGPASSSTSMPVAPTTASAPTASAPASTPRPPATNPTPSVTASTVPVPAPGEAFSGEGITVAQANDLQRSVDEGHQPWRTDAKLVAEAFVQGRLGWSAVDSRLTDPHTAEVTNRADGRVVVLQLRQPARVGQGGIWTVVGGVWVK